MNFEIRTLKNGVHVAELFGGKTGSAEDYTGSEIPEGYIRVIRAIYEKLSGGGIINDGEEFDVAAPTSLWVSACLQAKQASVPVGKIICPFASMPWSDDALLLCPVTAEEAAEYNTKLLATENYTLFPRGAAACLAAEKLSNTRPVVLLATLAP